MNIAYYVAVRFALQSYDHLRVLYITYALKACTFFFIACQVNLKLHGLLNCTVSDHLDVVKS